MIGHGPRVRQSPADGLLRRSLLEGSTARAASPPAARAGNNSETGTAVTGNRSALQGLCRRPEFRPGLGSQAVCFVKWRALVGLTRA